VPPLAAYNDDARAAKCFEAQHRAREPFDGPVVLLDDVVQILALTELDIGAGVSLDAFNGRQVDPAFVDGDLLWQVMQVDGPRQNAPRSSQIPLGSEQEVDRCPDVKQRKDARRRRHTADTRKE
jgi:hypothetical protein